jgi:hypothetical protein
LPPSGTFNPGGLPFVESFPSLGLLLDAPLSSGFSSDVFSFSSPFLSLTSLIALEAAAELLAPAELLAKEEEDRMAPASIRYNRSMEWCMQAVRTGTRHQTEHVSTPW